MHLSGRRTDWRLWALVCVSDNTMQDKNNAASWLGAPCRLLSDTPDNLGSMNLWRFRCGKALILDEITLFNPRRLRLCAASSHPVSEPKGMWPCFRGPGNIPTKEKKKAGLIITTLQTSIDRRGVCVAAAALCPFRRPGVWSVTAPLTPGECDWGCAVAGGPSTSSTNRCRMQQCSRTERRTLTHVAAWH